MDNRYYEFGCPALMSDGRHLTNYLSAPVINQKIRNINKIKTTNEFRSFLQKNATKIIKNENKYLEDNFKCKKKTN